MKAKIKVIVIGIIMIGLAGMYSVIDKYVSIYDTSCDTGQFQWVFLEENKEVAQRFVSKEKELDAIAFKVAADDNMDRGKIILSYQLTDHLSGDPVAKGEVNLTGLKVGKFFKIRFPKVENCKGKEYEFRMFLKQRGEDGNVRVFYTPGSSEKAEFSYDNTKIDGIGVFRTVTHRFDLETFVITLGFLVYIVVFMRWLYRLFK